MWVGPGDGLERRRLELGLGRSGRRFVFGAPLGVRLLLLVQPLNKEPTELFRPSLEVVGTKVFELSIEPTERFRRAREGVEFNVFAREVVDDDVSAREMQGTRVSDEAFSGRGLLERPSRSLLN